MIDDDGRALLDERHRRESTRECATQTKVKVSNVSYEYFCSHMVRSVKGRLVPGKDTPGDTGSLTRPQCESRVASVSRVGLTRSLDLAPACHELTKQLSDEESRAGDTPRRAHQTRFHARAQLKSRDTCQSHQIHTAKDYKMFNRIIQMLSITL